MDRVGAVIEPRAQWPTGMSSLGLSLSGRIPVDERYDEGRALARLTDLGWGNTLREIFAAGAADVPLQPAVLNACARVLGEWAWAERPVAVVSVPSRTRPQLVSSLAQGLAGLGRLPYLGELASTAVGAPSETGGNSAFRLSRVWGTLHATGLDVPAGPVLLVDDIADSRWTLQAASSALRAAGATRVLPFTLALRA